MFFYRALLIQSAFSFLCTYGALMNQDALPPVVKTEAEPIEVVSSQDDSQMKIDTVESDGATGNWLRKRVFWEKAQVSYEAIKKALDVIFDIRMQFFTQRTKLDKEVFDPFYNEIGFDRGRLQEFIERIMLVLEKQRSDEGVLNSEDRALLENFKEHSTLLKKAKENVDAIIALDHTVDDTIMQTSQLMNSAREYMTQAWDNFKQIGKELSDKKARELYYAIKTFEENVIDIQRYMQNEVSTYLDRLFKDAMSNVTAIRQSLNELKAKGAGLKAEFQRLEVQKTLQEKRKEIVRENDKKEEQEEEYGLFARIGYGFKMVGSMILSPFFYVFRGVASLYSTIVNVFYTQETEQEEMKAAETDGTTTSTA